MEINDVRMAFNTQDDARDFSLDRMAEITGPNTSYSPKTMPNPQMGIFHYSFHLTPDVGMLRSAAQW